MATGEEGIQAAGAAGAGAAAGDEATGGRPPGTAAAGAGNAPGGDAAENLSFIRGVMGRTQNQTRRQTIVTGLWWFALSVLATGGTWLLIASGRGTGLSISGVWLAHNVLGWAGTLIMLRGSGVLSANGRKILETWAVATVAVWAVVTSSILAKAIPPWTIFPMIQLVNGLVTACGGIILRNGVWVGAGVVLIALTPVVMGVLPPLAAYFGAGILIMATYAVIGMVDGIRAGIRRAESGQ